MPLPEGFLVPRNHLKTKNKKRERKGKIENFSTVMELPSTQKLKDDTSGEYRFHLNHKLTNLHQMNYKGSLASNGSLQIHHGFLLKYFLCLCFISVHPKASFSLVKKTLHPKLPTIT